MQIFKSYIYHRENGVIPERRGVWRDSHQPPAIGWKDSNSRGPISALGGNRNDREEQESEPCQGGPAPPPPPVGWLPEVLGEESQPPWPPDTEHTEQAPPYAVAIDNPMYPSTPAPMANSSAPMANSHTPMANSHTPMANSSAPSTNNNPSPSNTKQPKRASKSLPNSPLKKSHTNPSGLSLQQQERPPADSPLRRNTSFPDSSGSPLMGDRRPQDRKTRYHKGNMYVEVGGAAPVEKETVL